VVIGLNKIDAIDPDDVKRKCRALARAAGRDAMVLPLSAVSGEGVPAVIGALFQAIETRARRNARDGRYDARGGTVKRPARGGAATDDGAAALIAILWPRRTPRSTRCAPTPRRSMPWPPRGRAMVEALRRGGRVFSCGNGGSMCDAMHFAEDIGRAAIATTAGRWRRSRSATPGI